MSQELKKLLLEEIQREFEESKDKIDKNISRYQEYLLKIDDRELWSLPISIQGSDTKNPDLKYFDLLEKVKLLDSKLEYTHRNINRIFTLTEKGKDVIEKIKLK